MNWVPWIIPIPLFISSSFGGWNQLRSKITWSAPSVVTNAGDTSAWLGGPLDADEAIVISSMAPEGTLTSRVAISLAGPPGGWA